MKIARDSSSTPRPRVRKLAGLRSTGQQLIGNNRPIMRHSDGSLHAVLVEHDPKQSRLALFGAESAGQLRRLAPSLAGEGAPHVAEPATDSNQNGTYVAFVQGTATEQAGYVVHVPDPFGRPEERHVFGPLTPVASSVTNSFLQASRGYNSLAYAWRLPDTGEIFVGVSDDGARFPPATAVVKDRLASGGPAVGIFGDYVVVVYQTANRKMAGKGAGKGAAGEQFLAFCESHDLGRTWSKPAPLVADVETLPAAPVFSLASRDELARTEVGLSSAVETRGSLQALVWVDPSSPDKRIFALATLRPATGGSKTAPAGGVGVLAWKPYSGSGPWRHVLANGTMFRPSAKGVKRAGQQFKYCALPGTSVRVIAYVDRAAGKAREEDRIVLLVSVNMGDSFDYESVFTASQLGMEGDRLVISNSACTHRDAKGNLWQDLLVTTDDGEGAVRHAMLPVGVNVQGQDPTAAW